MVNDMTGDYRGEERDKSEFGGLWVTGSRRDFPLYYTYN